MIRPFRPLRDRLRGRIQQRVIAVTWDKIKDRLLAAAAVALAAFLGTLFGQPNPDKVADLTAKKLTAHYASLPAAK